MTKYIDVEQLEDALDPQTSYTGSEVVKIAYSLDAPDVIVPVHAKWIHKYSRPGVYADLRWYCSACDKPCRDSWANLYEFCPHCQAIMDEKDEES